MNVRLETVPLLIGASLKMYMGHKDTLDWARDVRDVAQRHPAVQAGIAEVFLLPSFPTLAPVSELFVGTSIKWGAQDLFWEDSGAFTGEVGAPQLREIGCSYVEIGHAERREILGETDAMVSAKMLAAFRNGLVPVLCVGEASRASVDIAASECIRQFDASLERSREAHATGPAVIAYEPRWAIGAAEAAHPDYIRDVVGQLKEHIGSDAQLVGSRVIYGGSAGPGLLTRLGGAVDGLFMGRSAHDPAAFATVLDEVWALSNVPTV
jgi:triosephosphate isomerase